MGIPYYFWSVCKKYPKILQPSLPDPVHYLHIDFNGAIHPAVQGVLRQLKEPGALEPGDLEALFQEEIWASFKNIQRLTNPVLESRIYVDGVAPIAKMAQQRKRRYLSHKRYELLKTAPVWDTNAISPGTEFMNQLEVFLKKKLRHMSHTHLSPASEPGEGEHKIFQFLRTLKIQTPDRPLHHVIHGLDADLIMLSLLSHCPGIYLMRENQAQERLDFVNIHELRIGLLQELDVTHPDLYPYSPESCQYIESYVLLCMLLGNDFLPHSAALSLKKDGHEKLLKAYKSHHQPLLVSADGTIAWHHIAEILATLAQEERNLLVKYAQDYLRRPPPHGASEQDRIEAYPRIPSNIHPYTQLLTAGTQRDLMSWRQNYYKYLFRTRMYDTQMIRDSCEAYARGILWTFHYYRGHGLDSNYNYPFPYAPTLQDLANFMEAQCDTLGRLQEEYSKAPTLQFVHPVVQLASILPLPSFHLLPQHIRSKLMDPKQGLSHLYPTKYSLETFLKTYLWECEPVLPFMEVSLLQKKLGCMEAC